MKKKIFVIKAFTVLAFVALLVSPFLANATEINTVPAAAAENQSGYTPANELGTAQNMIEGAVAVDQAAEDFSEKLVKNGVMGGPVYEYDGLGRIIKTTFDTGDFIITNYWGDTANKRTDNYFHPGWIWDHSFEYRGDGVTLHYMWIADVNPGKEGDDHLFEYDLDGKLIMKQLDDESWIFIDYWASGNIKNESYLDADWTWEWSIEYFDTADNIIHYKWTDDHHIKTGDVIKQENDAQGRMIFRLLDDGGMITTEYWDNGNRKSSSRYDAGWIWSETIKYKEADGLTVQYHWMTDADVSINGDVVYLEYDLAGRLINRTFDDTSMMLDTYWDEYTSPRYKEDYYGPGWSWQNSIIFWENGVIMHYQWIVDSNPSTTGDIVYEEYDITGVSTFKRFDDGTIWHI